MKPKLEDVLFLEKDCEHADKYNRDILDKKNVSVLANFCPNIELKQDILEKMIKKELKDKYYPGFIKYFKSNSEDCILKASKNAQKSVEARIKGNALFAKKEHNVDIHKDTWELYSKAIALAPIGSKELVLAYECRSNLLLHFEEYEDCIKDIDTALALTEFDLLKVKLLCRKMSCFAAVEKDVVEKTDLWKTLECHYENISDALKDEKFLKMIEQAKNDVNTVPKRVLTDKKEESTQHTSLDEISLMLNKEGLLTADRDLEPGETIIVTKPTIANVNPNKFYAYCSHCLSFMLAGIPCDECCLFMFCSEKCKTEAWEKYHMLECKILPHIDFSYSVYFLFSSVIKIFLVGVREFGNIPNLLNKIREVEHSKLKDNPSFMENDKFFKSDFLNIYTLPSFQITDSCSLSISVKHTCFLMAYLTQVLECIFEKEFGSMKGKELAKDKDFVYSIAVMTKILILCEMYAHYPYGKRYCKCSKNENLEDCLSTRCCPIGTIFHFHKGLMQKSCDPNVMICQTHDGNVIYYCIQPINKMELITVADSVPFYEHDSYERWSMRPDASSIYALCKCIACQNKWPPFLKETNKFLAKSRRRSSKVQSKGTQLLEKYMHRINNDRKKFLANISEEEFRELATDTNVVVSTCGQPAFASCWMMSILRDAFIILYGDFPLELHVPDIC